MDICRGFLTTLIDEDRVNEATRSGITQDFLDDDSRSIFAYIQRYYGEYKSAPSRDAVQKQFPGYEFGSFKEPLDYFIENLKEQYRKRILDEGLSNVAELYLKDTKRAEALLRDTIAKLHVTKKTFQDVDVSASAEERFKAYQIRKESPGANGILSNWPEMDAQTLGYQPEEFAVLVGEKYMGKSWILIWEAIQAAKQGERVLLATSEMSQEAVTRRFDSIYAQVPFDSLRKGELSHEEEKRYKEKMDELAESSLYFVVARQGVNTIEDIESKAIEVDATIIFGDSIYLFDATAKSNASGETNRRLEISRKCKAVAKSLGIPFVVSVQAGRKKNKTDNGARVPTLDDIEWSNAFSQDADTVFFLHKEDVDRELKRAQIHLLKSRDGDKASFYIQQNFHYMDFSQRGDKMQPTTEIKFDDEEVIDYGPDNS